MTKILKEKNTVDSQRLSELQKEFQKPSRSNAEIAAQGDKAKAIADLGQPNWQGKLISRNALP